MLTAITLDMRACSTDHGACLGKCDSTRVPWGMQDQTINLPESMVGALTGRRFHIAHTNGHYIIRDYDCLIAEQGNDLDLVLTRFGASLMEQRQRIADGVLVASRESVDVPA